LILKSSNILLTNSLLSIIIRLIYNKNEMSWKDQKVIKQIQWDIKHNLQLRDTRQWQFDIVNSLSVLKDSEWIDKQLLLLTEKAK